MLAVTLAGSLSASAGFTFVGIWAIRELGADKSDLGLAFLFGAFVSAVGGYVGGHLSDHFGRRPLLLVASGGSALYWLGYLLADASVASGLVYLACAGVLFGLGGGAGQAMVADLVPPERHEAAYAIPVVVFVIFLFVIGEMLWVPTSQSVVAGLAPEDVRGAYMGAFGSGAATGFALAPFFGLSIGDRYGDTTMWAFFAAVSVMAAVFGAVAARGVRTRPESEGLPATTAVA